MKKINKLSGIISLFAVITLSITSCPEDKDTPAEDFFVQGGEYRENVLFLTVGSQRDLNEDLPENMKKPITWTTSDAAVASITENGIVKALSFTDGGSDRFYTGTGNNINPATGTAAVTATPAEGTPHTITVTTTTEAIVNIMDLPPLKDQLSKHFKLVGNIFGSTTDITGSNSINRITRHYNVLTHENIMKPEYLVSRINGSTVTLNTGGINTAKNTIDAARKANIKIVGHTLLWHSQNPSMSLPANKDDAIATMKDYITKIAGHESFKGKIYSWDVLNEVFPDSVSATADWKTSMRGNNPWNARIGSDFIYEAFLATRLADPNAILYYNDYNTDQVAKATMIRNMVLEVNNKYLASNDKPEGEDKNRLLIEGIGMQEHHNTGVSAASVRATLKMFDEMTFTGSNRKIKIAVSELDVLGQGFSAFSSSGGNDPYVQSSSTVTNDGLMNQARLYGEYMKVYIEYKHTIERISIWGVTDNSSWRSRGLPLLFSPQGNAKPSYFSFVNALEDDE